MSKTYATVLVFYFSFPLLVFSGEKIQLVDKLRHEQNLEGSIDSISASPDGKQLAAAYNIRAGASAYISKRSGQGGSIKGTIVLWDLVAKKVIKEFLYSGVIHNVKFSSNGKYLVVAYTTEQGGQQIRVLDVPSLKELCDFEIKLKEQSGYFNLTTIAISPNNKNVLAGVSMSPQAEIMIFDLNNGKYIKTLNAGELSIHEISFSENGNLMASVSEDKVKIWETEGYKERNSFLVQRGWSAQISPDGNMVAVSTSGSRNYGGKVGLTLNDSRTGKELFDLGCLKSGGHLEFAGNGKYLLQSVGGFLVIYETKNGEKIFLTDGPQVQSMTMLPKSNILATGNQTGSIWLWEIISD